MTSSLLVRPGGVSLRELLAGDAQFVGLHDVFATTCAHDARQVRPGDVFVALTESDEDGHDRAAEAAERGAAAVISERLVPVFGVPQFVVSDSHAAYGRLCQALVGNPTEEIKVIGVTGTSGKTTVSQLLRSIIRKAGGEAGTVDSLGNYTEGRRAHGAGLPRLTPPSLARSLACMAADGLTHAIIEVSSEELNRQVLAGVELDGVCLTNVWREQIGLHGTAENYRRATSRIFDHLHAAGVAVLNADDPLSVELLDELDAPALTFGIRNPAEITAEVVERQVNEQTIVLTAGDESVGVRTTIVGDHHVLNCLTAAALSLTYRIELTTIAQGLEAVERLPGRMERIARGQPCSILVDSAHTPHRLRAALQAARRVTPGRLICVFGAGGNSQPAERIVLGRVLGASADLAVLTSGCPSGAGTREVTRDVLRGVADRRKVKLIEERAAAIAWALDEAGEGDTVLVAGMGDQPYGAFGPEGVSLDDRQVTEQLLSGALPASLPRRIAA